MHFFKFNIGDYLSHTSHLTDTEDLAYRRMLDWYYLHEKPLPKNIDDIAKSIRMRSHCDCIANVLREFFIETENGYENNRANSEIISYHSKSDKAKQSSSARWSKNNNKNKQLKPDANAMRTQCERNANAMLNTKQETLNTKQEKNRPSVNEIELHMCLKADSQIAKIEAEKFFNYYESNGWKVGKNPMKNWKAAASGWLARRNESERNRKNESGDIDFNSTGWSEGIVN